MIIENNNRIADPIERFMGGELRILTADELAIGNNISLLWHDVVFRGPCQPEEQGRLYLFPVDDGRFCLQLCYMVYSDTRAQNERVVSLKFFPDFFDQFPPGALMDRQPFRFDQSTEEQFPVCALSASMLEEMFKADSQNPLTTLLHRSQLAIGLLRRALECITVPFEVCQVPACRFLAYESEREKILAACGIIAQNMDNPLTIRELSRRVAINECYLKKGFKAMTGKTIHEYQQELRITKAKELLKIQGQSVTDVAMQLGFSSISHFSTAFKRVTGMKPCELLA